VALTAAPLVAVAGETLVDLLTGGGRLRARPGGSPANTAVALARLGVPVTLLARFADDDYGRLLHHHVSSNGVDLSHAVNAVGRSSIARVTRTADGSAAYDFDINGTVDWDWAADDLPTLPDSVRAVHSGSLALARSPALEAWVRNQRGSATVCIDPNVRVGLVNASSVATVERWLSFADIVKVSTNDLALLYPTEDPHDVARRWSRAGPALVVVTAAEHGATAYADETELHRDAVAVDVADTIGAGDAFTAGLLHALLECGRLGVRLNELTSDEVGTALEHAATVAALTCIRTGADPPTLSAVRALAR